MPSGAAAGLVLAAAMLWSELAPAAAPRRAARAVPVNQGGASALIRAASQITGIEIVDAATGETRAQLTSWEVKSLAALLRVSAPYPAQVFTNPSWEAVFLIHTRSRGAFVVFLLREDTLRLEVPESLARRFGVPAGVPRDRLVEVTLPYASWVWAALEARLGPPTNPENQLPPPMDTNLDEIAPRPRAK
jgi:hypothetical protein